MVRSLGARLRAHAQGMERELEKLWDPETALQDDAAAERDALFAAAEEVSRQLSRIGSQLCDAIEQAWGAPFHAVSHCPRSCRRCSSACSLLRCNNGP